MVVLAWLLLFSDKGDSTVQGLDYYWAKPIEDVISTEALFQGAAEKSPEVTHQAQ